MAAWISQKLAPRLSLFGPSLSSAGLRIVNAEGGERPTLAVGRRPWRGMKMSFRVHCRVSTKHLQQSGYETPEAALDAASVEGRRSQRGLHHRPVRSRFHADQICHSDSSKEPDVAE
jgi:hypothetical protein